MTDYWHYYYYGVLIIVISEMCIIEVKKKWREISVIGIIFSTSAA